MQQTLKNGKTDAKTVENGQMDAKMWCLHLFVASKKYTPILHTVGRTDTTSEVQISL